MSVLLNFVTSVNMMEGLPKINAAASRMSPRTKSATIIIFRPNQAVGTSWLAKLLIQCIGQFVSDTHLFSTLTGSYLCYDITYRFGQQHLLIFFTILLKLCTNSTISYEYMDI